MSAVPKRHAFLFNAIIATALSFGSGQLGAATGVVTTPASPMRAVVDNRLAPGADARAGNAVEVSALLRRQLAAGAKADFAIEFRERADLSAAHRMDWNERGRDVHDRLRETAERSQAAVRRLLAARGVAFEPHWIKNTIVVRQGDRAALDATSRFTEVLRIRELPDTRLVESERSTNNAPTASPGGIGGNISWIGAPEAWAQGTTGSGVTVGVIDNGVQYTHQALVKQYRGYHDGAFEHDYNWYDQGFSASEPYVDGARGTAATGVIVGDDRNPDPAARNRIGVAPDAQWIACQGFPPDGDPTVSLLGCAEFMLAPSRRDGSSPDPDRRPQVVNNSWFEEGACNGTPTPFYADVVEAWVAAGIFPVFAAGNSFGCGLPQSPGLSTVASPASLGSAFAVGSTGNHDGQPSVYTLWGPTSDASAGLPDYPDPRGFPQMKPQVVAPGLDIRTANAGSDAGYASSNGSSMSAPHITGLVALMLDAGGCLRGDYATLGTLIMQTARPIAYDSGGDPAPGFGNVPNYVTGWGEINVPAAVTAAADACGPQGFIAGRVTNAAGAPIAGAQVEFLIDPAVRVHQVTTDADGHYIRRVPQLLSGGYTVRISAYGYLPSSETGALVSHGATTPHDAQLASAPMHKISGRVTDSATGWPLHARVRIGGYPGAPLWTDPVTGGYSVRLPEGAAFRFDVSTELPGYLPASRDIPSLGGSGSQDFALSADVIACSAPGYGSASTVLSEGFEDVTGAPPVGWTRSSAGLGWLFGTSAELSATFFRAPEHGRFAATNDELGGGKANDGRNDMLIMPVLNLAGLVEPVLRYTSFVPAEGPRATVEASTDGGATWAALGVPHPTSAAVGWGWTNEALSLASVAGANVRLRFHSDDGTTDAGGRYSYGWAIDDVAVTANCSAPSQGGLVIGHVRDANTGAALDGAAVNVNDGSSVSTSSSADPAVGAGFYAIHAPAGTPTLKAQRGAQAPGYGDAIATPLVGNGTTVQADLGLPAGRLRLYPAGPMATVELGTTTTAPLTLTNSGTQSLQFGFEQAALEEHFEGSIFPPAGWSVENLGGDCSWDALDLSSLGNYAGGNGGAAAVDLFPCFGGAASDSTLTTPAIDLASSQTASMGFFLSLSDGMAVVPRLDIDVSRDGGATWVTAFTETRDNNGIGPGALIELDLTPFIGSSDVRVRFHYTATPPWGWVIVDQVHLFNSVSMSAMLDLEPAVGSLAAGESRTLDALFDARTIAQPGIYRLPIRVAEDTPYDWPFGDVEARMTVTAPASYGSIGGTVQSLGYCDANPRALAGAAVTIQSSGGQTWTTTTASDGSYRYWMEPAQGPFTVTVAAPDHAGASRQVVVSAGAQAAGGFDLRALQPCLLTDPATLSAVVASGQGAQNTFALLNIGAAATAWTLRTGGDPALLSQVPLIQTTSSAPEQDISFACAVNGLDRFLDNRYLRVFPLAELGLPQQNVMVSGVSFAIHSATSPQGTQPLTLRIHSLSGDLRLDNLHLLQEKTIAVADTSLQRMSVVFDQPLSVPGDSVLVAEIHASAGAGKTFYPGANTQGESAPAYWLAPDCGVEELMAFPEAGVGWAHLVLEIDTLASDPCGEHATPVDWLGISQPSGTLAADASTSLQALFTAAGQADGEHQGTLCLAPGNSATAPVVIPVTLHVGAAGDAIFADGFD